MPTLELPFEATEAVATPVNETEVELCHQCGGELTDESDRTLWHDEWWHTDCLDNSTVGCESCGDRVSNEDALETCDSDYVCAHCSENYSRCNECDRMAPQSRTVTDSNIGVCVFCCRDHYTFCDCCNDLTRVDDSRSVRNGLACEACYDNYYRECDSCNDTVYEDHGAYRDDDGDDWICNRCHERESTGVIQNYSTKIRIPFKGKGPLYFGVELEVESTDNRDKDAVGVNNLVKDFAILKEDGSLDKGFEIVSCPATLDVHRKIWDKFFAERPRSLRSYNTSTCGMHVHISRDALTPLQIGKMLVFLNEPDNADFVRKIAQRVSDRWAKCSKKKHSDIQDSSDRYVALNLSNTHTVEIRIFRGTLKKESFHRNIEFCHALVQFCETHRYSIEHCRHAANFAVFVSQNRKLYPNLYNFTSQHECQDEQ